jgi:hypothetical protein
MREAYRPFWRVFSFTSTLRMHLWTHKDPADPLARGSLLLLLAKKSSKQAKHDAGRQPQKFLGVLKTPQKWAQEPAQTLATFLLVCNNNLVPLLPSPGAANQQGSTRVVTRINSKLPLFWLNFLFFSFPPFCFLKVHFCIFDSTSPAFASTVCYSLTHAHRPIGYRNPNPQHLAKSAARLIYLRVYDSWYSSCKPASSPSICYSLTHAHSTLPTTPTLLTITCTQGFWFFARLARPTTSCCEPTRARRTVCLPAQPSGVLDPSVSAFSLSLARTHIYIFYLALALPLIINVFFWK